MPQVYLFLSLVLVFCCCFMYLKVYCQVHWTVMPSGELAILSLNVSYYSNSWMCVCVCPLWSLLDLVSVNIHLLQYHERFCVCFLAFLRQCLVTGLKLALYSQFSSLSLSSKCQDYRWASSCQAISRTFFLIIFNYFSALIPFSFKSNPLMAEMLDIFFWLFLGLYLVFKGSPFILRSFVQVC